MTELEPVCKDCSTIAEQAMHANGVLSGVAPQKYEVSTHLQRAIAEAVKKAR